MRIAEVVQHHLLRTLILDSTKAFPHSRRVRTNASQTLQTVTTWIVIAFVTRSATTEFGPASTYYVHKQNQKAVYALGTAANTAGENQA